MKKSVFIAALAMGVLSCKKNENSEVLNISGADSAASVTKTSDTVGKLAILEQEKSKQREDFKASLPGVDSAFTIPKEKEVQPRRDSLPKPLPTLKVLVAPEHIVHEKKIIYRNLPKERAAAHPREMKSAHLEFESEEVPKSVQIIREVSENYNGRISSEKENSEDDSREYSLEIVLPAPEFSNFINSLEFGKIGTPSSKIIKNTGDSKWAEISVKVSGTSNSSEAGRSFGAKTLGAVSAGASAVGSIILFLLPFWPLFLTAAAAFLYYRSYRAKNKVG